MKKAKFYLGVVALALSVEVFAQYDVKLDDNVLLSGSGANELVKSLDKGKVIENGIFFTKSFYEEKGLTKTGLLKDVKKQLSKTFEVEVEQGGNYFFAAHVLPANNVDKISTEKTDGKITGDRIDILEVRVYLNERFIGTLNQTKLDWELAPLKEVKTVSLPASKKMQV